MDEKILEIIKLINNSEDKEYREKMFIHIMKFNESNKEMEDLFNEIKRRCNESSY